MGGSVPPLSGLGDNLPLLYRRVCYVLMVYYIRPSSSNCLRLFECFTRHTHNKKYWRSKHAELYYCCLLCTLNVLNFSLLHPKSSIGGWLAYWTFRMQPVRNWEHSLGEKVQKSVQNCVISVQKAIFLTKFFWGPTGEGHSPPLPRHLPFALLTISPLFTRLQRHWLHSKNTVSDD